MEDKVSREVDGIYRRPSPSNSARRRGKEKGMVICDPSTGKETLEQGQSMPKVHDTTLHVSILFLPVCILDMCGCVGVIIHITLLLQVWVFIFHNFGAENIVSLMFI